MSVQNQFTGVDQEIYDCLNIEAPRSFFLFAGAGSGKTGSLVKVLTRIRDEKRRELSLYGKRIGVITYTNAACDEIRKRLEFDSIFVVQTIHSFSWELIKPYQIDIRSWVSKKIDADLMELQNQLLKGRTGTKIESERKRQMEVKEHRRQELDSIKVFSYNPNGANTGRDALNHSEVIGIASEFIASKSLMGNILVQKFPILFIDESQDTKKELIDALFSVQALHRDRFCLGLFGDTMQRIYADGKIDLGVSLPEDWARPQKTINYRCPTRIIRLLNQIRDDGQEQEAVSGAIEGLLRLFIVEAKPLMDKTRIETEIMSMMVAVSGDEEWTNPKILTLEHHMAARRSGFQKFFEPLYEIAKQSSDVLEGTLSGIPFLIRQVLPLIQAKRRSDEFEVARIVRKYSPLLQKEFLGKAEGQIANIERAKAAVDMLQKSLSVEPELSLRGIIQCIRKSGLFEVPDSLAPFIFSGEGDSKNIDQDVNVDGEGWNAALNCPLSELEAYAEYISDKSRFGTHQGVKGLEFPRVMVIMDDPEARGFLFSYEKLFGAKEPSPADQKNIKDKKETSFDRTRRLFYVTCSRAEKSLALVAYTENPKAVESFALAEGWFEPGEICHV